MESLTKRGGLLKLTRAWEILEQATEEDDFLLKPLLPRVGLSIVAGSPGSGKSSLVRSLAVSLTNGEERWLGLELAKERSKALRETGEAPAVVLLHLEESKASVYRHLKELGLSPNARLSVLDLEDLQDPVSSVSLVLSAEHPALVIVDTMVELLQIREINAYTEVVGALQEYRALAEQAQTHFLFTHHSPKQHTSAENALLGSTGIRASVDTALVYRKLPRTGTRILECSKVRVGEEIPALAVGLDEKRGSFALGPADEAIAREHCSWFRTLIESEGRPLTKGDLAQATGLPLTEVWQALRLDPDQVLGKITSKTSTKYTAQEASLAEQGRGWEEEL